MQRAILPIAGTIGALSEGAEEAAQYVSRRRRFLTSDLFDSDTFKCYIKGMQEDARYDLKSLCAEAEVTPRTVHFYIQTGLLRPAGTPGPGARYDVGHLSRLRLIRLLQKEHLPLAEIRTRLEALSDAEVQELLRERESQRERGPASALDYVRSVLSGQRSEPTRSRTSPARTNAQAKTGWTASERSHWERISFSPDVELHVRRPLSREQNQQVDQLVTLARRLFREEKS